jgi:hypothetical protein
LNLHQFNREVSTGPHRYLTGKLVSKGGFSGYRLMDKFAVMYPEDLFMPLN